MKNPAASRWRVVASLGVVTVLVAACSGHKSAAQPPSGTSASVATSPTLSAPVVSSTTVTTAAPTAAAVKTYGYGASPTGADYQPDVVVVGGGAASIRSASSNGLTWTIAKAAPGADKLTVGSVMVLTSVATGRVAAIHDDGDSRVVTLAPVNLTDVIRNGSIDVDQAVPASAISYRLIPDRIGAQSVPTTGDLPSANIAPSGYRGTQSFTAQPFTAQAAGLHRAAPQPGGTMPLASESALDVKVGAWKLSPIIANDKLELGVERDGALKVGIDFAFDTNNLRFHGIDTIKNGQTSHSAFEITGITGLTISLQAGAAGGNADNEKIKIEAPIEANLEIPPSPATGGLPLDLKVQFIFTVETAITGNNSTLVATGIWGLDGPIGYDGENFQTPKFTVKQSIIDSITGITLGPSGVVFGVEMKFQVGVGVASLSAGPFAGVIVDLGVTNGSSLGAALARCKGATLDLRGSAGVGIELSAADIPILKDLLPGAKYEYSLGTSTSLLHRSQVVPDVPLCNAGI